VFICRTKKKARKEHPWTSCAVNPPEYFAARAQISPKRQIAPVARELIAGKHFRRLPRKMGDWPFGIIGPNNMARTAWTTWLFHCLRRDSRVDGSQAATITAHNRSHWPALLIGKRRAAQKIPCRNSARRKASWAFGSRNRCRLRLARQPRPRRRKWTAMGHQRSKDSSPTAQQHERGRHRAAVTGKKGDGPKLFLPYRGARHQGVSPPRRCTAADVRSSIHRSLLQDVFVPDENMLGKQGDGSKADAGHARPGQDRIAAMGVGCAQELMKKPWPMPRSAPV